MFKHQKKYPECPMRNEALNCGVHGGFCIDAVSDEICDVLHNAYDLGFSHSCKAIRNNYNKNDPVLSAMNEVVGEYGDQCTFAINGKEYTTPEIMNHLRNNTDIGLKFRMIINEMIITYIMKLYCEWLPLNEPVSYSDKRPDWCPLEET
jgi:hypothetical protein